MNFICNEKRRKIPYISEVEKILFYTRFQPFRLKETIVEKLKVNK